jgi:hypothetical protein
VKDSAEPKRRVHGLVKAFVLIHLVCITSWSLPNPPEGVIRGTSPAIGSDHILVWNTQNLKTNRPLNAYLFTTGFWQYWDMFAPDPSNTDIWGDAEIVFRDGSVKRYQYPRIYLEPIPSKIPLERFRKFYERANNDNFRYLWPQFALRIAYLHDDRANPPVEVRLRRHWFKIAPPGQPQPKQYNSFVYFVYAVDPKQLDQMRRGE